MNFLRNREGKDSGKRVKFLGGEGEGRERGRKEREREVRGRGPSAFVKFFVAPNYLLYFAVLANFFYYFCTIFIRGVLSGDGSV